MDVASDLSQTSWLCVIADRSYTLSSFTYLVKTANCCLSVSFSCVDWLWTNEIAV